MLEMKERLVVTAKAQFLPAEPVAVATLVTPKVNRGAADPSIDHRIGPAAVWQTASSVRIRAAESTVIVATMAYFAYGVAAALGLF
jgi:hypothetical protein